MKQRKWFRERLLSGQTIWSAGAYDALSAKLIEAAGFDAMLTTGFGISASHLGQPDVELYTMTENLNVVRQICNAVDIPVVADCDTGYGNFNQFSNIRYIQPVLGNLVPVSLDLQLG